MRKKKSGKSQSRYRLSRLSFLLCAMTRGWTRERETLYMEEWEWGKGRGEREYTSLSPHLIRSHHVRFAFTFVENSSRYAAGSWQRWVGDNERTTPSHPAVIFSILVNVLFTKTGLKFCKATKKGAKIAIQILWKEKEIERKLKVLLFKWECNSCVV